MFVNAEKSQIVHFRARASSRTMFSFTCGNEKLIVIDKCVSLGLTLTEFLDYNTTAKMVAQSDSRALGLLIAKCKSRGGACLTMFIPRFMMHWYGQLLHIAHRYGAIYLSRVLMLFRTEQ